MPEAIAVLRDLAIILLAVLNIILIALMILLLWQVWRLIKVIRTEMPKLVSTAKETTTQLRGTADFVSTTIVKPSIEATSSVAGSRRFLKVLVFGAKKTEAGK